MSYPPSETTRDNWSEKSPSRSRHKRENEEETEMIKKENQQVEERQNFLRSG